LEELRFTAIEHAQLRKQLRVAMSGQVCAVVGGLLPGDRVEDDRFAGVDLNKRQDVKGC
jgi:hypothetical protein